jgi:hypothetical protein
LQLVECGWLRIFVPGNVREECGICHLGGEDTRRLVPLPHLKWGTSDGLTRHGGLKISRREVPAFDLDLYAKRLLIQNAHFLINAKALDIALVNIRRASTAFLDS